MASIQGVYVALFGRPADPTGLAYFNSVTKDGADLSAIGDLAATAEYQEKYKGQNNIQIVTAIYNQLFNRNPEEAGLNFFVNALNNGTLNINNIAIAILDGAQGDDKKVVEAKIASADAFTKAIDTPIEDAAYRGSDAAKAAAAWISTITTTAATADEAAAELKKIVDTNFVGNTITAVATIATLDGTTGAGTPAVTTSDKNDTINAGEYWAPASSKVDGGLGVDTFNAEVGAAALVLGVDGLKNIEIINLSSTFATAAVNLAEAKQATQVWHAGTAGTELNLTVSGLALSTTVGLKGALDAAVTTFGFTDTSGTSDTVNVALDAAVTTGGLTINGVETIKFSATGASSIGVVSGDSVKAIEVSGAGNVTLDVSGLEKLATFTGNDKGDYVTTNVANLEVNQAINTGAGADLITVSTGTSNGYTLSLTGGAGADKFVFGVLNNVKSADAADFSKSLITITDFAKSEDVIDVSAGGDRDVLDSFELQTIKDAASLHAAVTAAAGFTDIGKQSVFIYGGDAYIFSNVAGAGFDDADGLVKITGISDVADFTATNFVI